MSTFFLSVSSSESAGMISNSTLDWGSPRIFLTISSILHPVTSVKTSSFPCLIFTILSSSLSSPESSAGPPGTRLTIIA